MPYLQCPDCGWTRSVERSDEFPEHCPRCLVGQRRAVELAVSPERPGPRWANAEPNTTAAAQPAAAQPAAAQPAATTTGEAAR